jgi:hypothetical protein
MGFATHLGPLRLGTIKDGSRSNLGAASVYQSVILTAPAQTAFLHIPAGAQIVDITADVTPLFNGTSPTLQLGSIATPTLIASGMALTAAGRLRPTFTAAQLAVLGDIGTANLLLQVQNTAANSSAGQVRVTIEYLIGAIAGSGSEPEPPPPVGGNVRITATSDTRVTSTGDRRVTA